MSDRAASHASSHSEDLGAAVLRYGLVLRTMTKVASSKHWSPLLSTFTLDDHGVAARAARGRVAVYLLFSFLNSFSFFNFFGLGCSFSDPDLATAKVALKCQNHRCDVGCFFEKRSPSCVVRHRHPSSWPAFDASLIRPRKSGARPPVTHVKQGSVGETPGAIVQSTSRDKLRLSLRTGAKDRRAYVTSAVPQVSLWVILSYRRSLFASVPEKTKVRNCPCAGDSRCRSGPTNAQPAAGTPAAHASR